MTAEDENEKPLAPSFFNGRVLVDIVTWEWALYVGVSRPSRREEKVGRGPDVVRTIILKGRIQAPQEHRGREIDVFVRPFGPEMQFSARGPHSVGSLSLFRSAPKPRTFEASLMLPETDLPTLAVALSTTTRYLHIWTRGLDGDLASISDYSLSATIGDRVKPWAGME